MEFHHKSVLLKEVIEYLQIKPDGVYADGTIGGAGHAYEIASRLTAGGRLIGMDQDEDAIIASLKRLSPYKDRVAVFRSNYCDIKQVFLAAGEKKADGILLDLGVSSFQLDTPERGFTYRSADAPLDMRMDTRQELTAKDVVNGYGERELCGIIRDYGEDRFAKNIAKHIVAARKKKCIQTAGELTEIIRAAVPGKFQALYGHPAKRAFQAIRIEVNQELFVLEHAVDDMIDLLNPKGRLCIITFHSLEDRIVKTHFRKNENPCTCPKDFPVCICGKIPKGTCVSRKPILPSETETAENSRAKSAKLRVFEKY